MRLRGRDAPYILLLATLASLPFYRPALGTIGPTPVVPTDILVGLSYLAAAVGWVRRRSLPPLDGLVWGAGAFVAAAALSIALSERAGPAHLLKVPALAAYALLPWLGRSILDDRERLRGAVRAWLLGGVVAAGVALAGVVAFFLVDRTILADLGCFHGRISPSLPRVCIPTLNANLLANYLTVTVALFLACGRALLPVAPVGIAVAACAVAVAFTFSPGMGGFALAVGVIVVALARQQGRRAGWVRSAVLAAAILGAAAMVVVTVGHEVPPGRGHVEIAGREFHFVKGTRVHTWLTTVETIREDPWTGTGYGLTVGRALTFDPTQLRSWFASPRLEPLGRGIPVEGHDVWLNVAGQTGLVGLAAFVFLVVQVGRRLSLKPIPAAGEVTHLPLAVAGGLIGAFLYHGLFMGAEEARHLWAFAALGVAAAASVRVGREAAEASPGTRPAS